MEKLIINILDGLVQLERKEGKLGTMLGVLLILVVTLVTISAAAVILWQGLSIINEILETFYGFRLY